MASGVKRSLFTKPAWAAPAATKPDSSTHNDSIFGRNVEYDDIVRAQKAERERKAARAKARSEGLKHKDDIVGPQTKRRRTSSVVSGTDEWARLEGLDDIDSNGCPKDSARAKPVTRSTPKKEKVLRRGVDTENQSPRQRNQKAYMINLDDGEEDELIMLTPPKPKCSTPKKAKTYSDDDNSDEEDDYLRELKAKAREKALLQRLQGSQTAKIPSTPLSRDTPEAASDAVIQPSSTAEEQEHPSSSYADTRPQMISSRGPAPLPEDDPEIKILIHSEIPDAKSLIVKRKASQSLQQVKEFWCRKFNLNQDVTRQVFFTWNGARLFDSTTMRGVMKKLKEDAYQKRKTTNTDFDDDDEGFDERTTKDPSEGNIMLEAVTQDILDRRAREKEEQQRQRDEEPGEDGGGENEPARVEPDKDDGAIIIRLVAKNLEPMQLRVRPNTTVGKIMRGFAATRKMGEDQTPWLIFEGERLEPEMTVEEAGFEDEEQVEVSVRGS